jgi:hypothetical protein
MRSLATFTGLAALLGGGPAGADAIVRTQAMFASTVAEIFVEEGQVRAEVEIGLEDLEAFRNLLPDALFEKLTGTPEPLAGRLPRFFRETLVVADAQGRPLPGRVLAMAPRERVRRDEITGEPLDPEEGAEREQVVVAELAWPLSGRPEQLVLAGPPGASVGFVVYHEGIPVNDFRYLGPSQTLRLDWEDPWYTRFDRRALRRTNFAPMSGFLYVDPFEVRKEIIARPLDLQHWVDLGLEGRETIPVEMQAELERKVAAFLRERQPVKIDGEIVEPELARVNFLERSLRTSRVIDPREELDLHSALLGVIFVYPTQGLPQKVSMDWDLWSERIQQVPAASVDQAGPLPSILEPDYRLLEWQNFLKNPELPTLVELAPPPSGLARAASWARWPLLALLLVSGALAFRAPRRRGAWAALALLLVLSAFWLARDAALSQERARSVVAGLLHNVYRAFDFRAEDAIYDTLDRSVVGDLLEQIYLETRKGLELASQGGARARVKALEVEELSAEPWEQGGFEARATWNVAGAVGHWGHVHERRNRYRAELRVVPVDGVWKLVALDILEEERL